MQIYLSRVENYLGTILELELYLRTKCVWIRRLFILFNINMNHISEKWYTFISIS